MARVGDTVPTPENRPALPSELARIPKRARQARRPKRAKADDERWQRQRALLDGGA